MLEAQKVLLMRVEKIEYKLRWRSLRSGDSFFIPCLDYARAKKKIHKHARMWGVTVLAKGVIESDIKGLRVWRI